MLDSEINARHKERWAAATKTYGSKFKVPGWLGDEIAEETRQAFVTLKEGSEESETNKGIRLAKRKAAETWIKDNVGRQVTTADLAAGSGWSVAYASIYIKEEPLTFVKVKHGLYEIRDEKAERAAAKG